MICDITKSRIPAKNVCRLFKNLTKVINLTDKMASKRDK